jgi:hypothetical protein
MRRSKAAVTAVLTTAALLAVAVVAVPASAGNGDDQARAKAQHERTIRYWTAERIANATPRDFVRAAGGALEPKAKPTRPPGGGGGDTTVVKGASWTLGGDVVQKTGKVLFTMGSSDYVCSATNLVDSRNGASLVLTAGHCAYDETARRFATNWTYMPSYDTSPVLRDCSQTTYGCWTASALVVHSGYATAGGFNDQATLHDFAVAVVGPGGKTGTQLEALGTFGIQYPGNATSQNVHSFGYPAAQKYKGNDLTYCAGPTFTDIYSDVTTLGIACNMTGGSSGGGWLANFSGNGTSGTLTSLNSYGYSGVSNMYGPIFNSDTRDVVAAANTATGNTIVP